MSRLDDLDSHLTRTGLPYEQIGHNTWVIQTESAHPAQIGVSADDPIVLFSISMFELTDGLADREELFKLLLEFNSELLHSSYSLQSDKVMLSGAQQLENLDFNEFQAMIDDMCMAVDKHWDKLAKWGMSASESKAAAAAEGSA